MCENFNYHSMAKMWDVKCTPSKQNTMTSFLYVIKTRRIHFTIIWHRGNQKQKYRNKTKPKFKQTKIRALLLFSHKITTYFHVLF